jgi:hypothetical protein
VTLAFGSCVKGRRISRKGLDAPLSKTKEGARTAEKCHFSSATQEDVAALVRISLLLLMEGNVGAVAVQGDEKMGSGDNPRKQGAVAEAIVVASGLLRSELVASASLVMLVACGEMHGGEEDENVGEEWEGEKADGRERAGERGDEASDQEDWKSGGGGEDIVCVCDVESEITSEIV